MGFIDKFRNAAAVFLADVRSAVSHVAGQGHGVLQPQVFQTHVCAVQGIVDRHRPGGELQQIVPVVPVRQRGTEIQLDGNAFRQDLDDIAQFPVVQVKCHGCLFERNGHPRTSCVSGHPPPLTAFIVESRFPYATSVLPLSSILHTESTKRHIGLPLLSPCPANPALEGSVRIHGYPDCPGCRCRAKRTPGETGLLASSVYGLSWSVPSAVFPDLIPMNGQDAGSFGFTDLQQSAFCPFAPSSHHRRSSCKRFLLTQHLSLFRRHPSIQGFSGTRYTETVISHRTPAADGTTC